MSGLQSLNALLGVESEDSFKTSTPNRENKDKTSSLGVDVDVELWLSSKLEEAWSSEKICSSLTTETLTAIRNKFSSLETSIKLRTLFSLLGLRKKLLDELNEPIKKLLEVASQDDDEWVRVVASILPILLSFSDSSMASNAIPPFSISDNVNVFAKTFQGLSHFLEQNDFAPQFSPLESCYLSSSVFELPAYATQNPHFVLKNSVKTDLSKKFEITKLGPQDLQAMMEENSSLSPPETSTFQTLASPPSTSLASPPGTSLSSLTPSQNSSLLSKQLKSKSSTPLSKPQWLKKSRMQLIEIGEVKELEEREAKKRRQEELDEQEKESEKEKEKEKKKKELEQKKAEKEVKKKLQKEEKEVQKKTKPDQKKNEKEKDEKEKKKVKKQVNWIPNPLLSIVF